MQLVSSCNVVDILKLNEDLIYFYFVFPGFFQQNNCKNIYSVVDFPALNPPVIRQLYDHTIRRYHN
jgi:hypothetical protein